MSTYTVYGDRRSGNCYKVALLMQHLAIDHAWIDMDILAGDTAQESFIARNPNGKIPLLETPAGETLAESNAILNYLAEDTAYLPDDRWLRAQVLQWQFFEQYSHEPYIAVARFIATYLGLPDDRRAEYEQKQAGGRKALAVMQTHLSERAFFVGDRPTIADISLFAYTHVAHEGGFDLGDFPAVQDWIVRMQALPEHLPIG